MKYKNEKIKGRKRRVRLKLRSLTSLPRLSVFRSNKYICAQIIDDRKRVTLAAANDREIKAGKDTKTDKAKLVGKLIAQKALKKGIKKVVFDRGPYQYHGRVKALAEGVREEGLQL